MQLIRHYSQVPAFLQQAVVTIGNFDGMHLGHQQLLAQLKAQADALGTKCGVILFEPQPQEFFSNTPPARLTSLRQKYRLIKQQGIDFLLVLRFNDKLGALSAEDFITQILVQGLRVRTVLVGQDFRFGHARAGDFSLLAACGQQLGFEVIATPDICMDGMRVSSTHIRALLAAGDFAQAAHLLGRPFAIEGKVIPGAARGRTLNMRTANIALLHKSVPIQGIFVARVSIKNNAYPAVVSLGTRPVFAGQQLILEVHIFDFNADIYGEHLCVEFLHKLRDEMNFASVELLQTQMQKDLLNARHYWKQHNND